MHEAGIPHLNILCLVKQNAVPSYTPAILRSHAPSAFTNGLRARFFMPFSIRRHNIRDLSCKVRHIFADSEKL